MGNRLIQATCFAIKKPYTSTVVFSARTIHGIVSRSCLVLSETQSMKDETSGTALTGPGSWGWDFQCLTSVFDFQNEQNGSRLYAA